MEVLYMLNEVEDLPKKDITAYLLQKNTKQTKNYGIQTSYVSNKRPQI
ncbi:hypothetical protein ACT7DJ_10645 [Bacillus cereus]